MNLRLLQESLSRLRQVVDRGVDRLHLRRLSGYPTRVETVQQTHDVRHQPLGDVVGRGRVDVSNCHAVHLGTSRCHADVPRDLSRCHAGHVTPGHAGVTRKSRGCPSRALAAGGRVRYARSRPVPSRPVVGHLCDQPWVGPWSRSSNSKSKTSSNPTRQPATLGIGEVAP